MRGKVAVGTALASALLLSGCATVQSTVQTHSKVAPGVAYFLPKRDIKISAERKLLKKADIEKAIKAKKGEQETNATTLSEAEALVKKLTAEAPLLANADAKAENAKELARATALVSRLTTEKGEIAAALGILEANLLAAAAAAGSECAFSYSAKLELMAPTADTSNRFVANISHNVLRDDEVKIVVTTDGLLSSGKAIATDRTGDIIVDIASAIAGFGSGSGVSTLNWVKSAASPKLDGLTCEQLPTKFTMRIDPSGSGQLGTLNGELLAAGFPFQIMLDPPPLATALRADTNTDIVSQGKAGALFYRSAIPALVTLRQCKVALDRCDTSAATSVPIDAAIVQLPQAGPVAYIPMRSSAFVKTVDDVVFENGMIVSWAPTRPSEVAEVVRIPVKILKAIVSVPAEIVKLRIDLSDQQKGLAASQQAQIAEQQKFLAFQRCLKLAGEDEAKAACMPK